MDKLHLVTGYAGKEHIQSADQGSFNASFFGTGEFVMEAGNQFEASIMDNNTVRILDGDALMKGRHLRIEPNTYADVTITTGTAGANRNDLIVFQYSKDTSTDIETIEIVVIKGTETAGTATDPAYTDGDILAGATFNQMPMYRVKVEGVVLTMIEPLFKTIPTYKTLAEQSAKDFREACNTHLNSLNVLDTKEEVEANTQENQLAGALALKEVISSTTEAIDKQLTPHVNNKSNPHNVTKSQVGLGNVPNVTTNDQTPTYSMASSNAALVSGEKLSVAFGKISKGISSLISHLSNKSNPHSVTATQTTYNDTTTGLGATTTQAAIEKLKALYDSINMQYLNGTADMIQIKDASGAWHNYASGGLLWGGYYYDNGTQAVSISQRSNYGGAGAKVTFNETNIVVSANQSTTGLSELIMSESKDLTNYDYVEFEYIATGTTDKAFVLGGGDTILDNWNIKSNLKNAYISEVFKDATSVRTKKAISLSNLTSSQKANVQVGIAVQGDAQSAGSVTIYAIRAYKTL